MFIYILSMSTLLSSVFIFKMSSSFVSAVVFHLGVEGEAGGGDELSPCVSGDDVDGRVELDFFEDLGVNISFILFLLCLLLFLYIFVSQVIIDVDFCTVLFFFSFSQESVPYVVPIYTKSH